MIRTFPLILAAGSLALVPSMSALAQPAVVDLDTAVRCSVLFALIAKEQAQGNEAARQFPMIEPRGKEFFVQAAARLMDEQHLDRDQTAGRFKAEMTALNGDIARSGAPEARLRALADPCLTLLDATLPPS